MALGRAGRMTRRRGGVVTPETVVETCGESNRPAIGCLHLSTCIAPRQCDVPPTSVRRSTFNCAQQTTDAWNGFVIFGAERCANIPEMAPLIQRLPQTTSDNTLATSPISIYAAPPCPCEHWPLHLFTAYWLLSVAEFFSTNYCLLLIWYVVSSDIYLSYGIIEEGKG